MRDFELCRICFRELASKEKFRNSQSELVRAIDKNDKNDKIDKNILQ